MPRRRYSRVLQEVGPIAPSTMQRAQADTAPPAVQPHALLQLQQAMGNQALQRMLIQREGEDAVAEVEAPEVVDAGPLLTPTQIIQAIAYYNARARDYPPEIILQLQQRLGTPETGRADREMVLAVAAEQQRINTEESGQLVIDGMAGPRTLPALFQQGLDEDTRQEAFVEFAEEQMADWGTLGTGEARAEAMMLKINELLSDSDVPECLVSVQSLPDLLGQFSFDTWTIEVGLDQFERDSVTVAEYADMANTLYHEARHAEQWFSMARMLAGQGKTAARITTMMGIPANIASEAVAKPFAPKTMEALVADGWYQSVYGVSATHRENVFKELDAADKALEAAQKAVQKNDNAGTRAALERARQRRQRAYDAYHSLPEEDDAHRVGDAITARLLLAPEIENMPE